MACIHFWELQLPYKDQIKGHCKRCGAFAVRPVIPGAYYEGRPEIRDVVERTVGGIIQAQQTNWGEQENQFYNLMRHGLRLR